MSESNKKPNVSKAIIGFLIFPFLLILCFLCFLCFIFSMNTIGFRTITRILHSNEKALLDKKYADPVTAIKNYPFALAAENMNLGGTDGSITETDSGIIVKVEVIDIKETNEFVANSKVYNVQLKLTEFPFYQDNYVINQKVQVTKDSDGWKVSKIIGFSGV